jgi:hypothetical protein
MDMPRKRELTYQTGSGGRGGRWRKKYHGVVYYFPAGSGKTDRTAYEQALEHWSQKKAEIDAQAVKPYDDDYRAAIIEWNTVLNWSTLHGDQRHAQLAQAKVKDLQARRCRANPKPLVHGDRMADTFELPTATLQAVAEAGLNIGNIDLANLELPTGMSSLITPNQQIADELAMTPSRLQARLWQDRIESQLSIQSEPQSATVDGNSQRFKELKEAEVTGKEISAGRYANLVLHLDVLVGFVGGTNPVTVFNERTMTDYRSALLPRVGKSEIKASYAKDRLDVAKQFVRWLWRQHALEEMMSDV